MQFGDHAHLILILSHLLNDRLYGNVLGVKIMKLKNRKIKFIPEIIVFGMVLCVASLNSMVAEACQNSSENAAGDSQVVEPGKSWMRASHAGKNTAAYFCACQISFPESDKLLRVESDIAKTLELHDHINDNGIMKMRPINFVEIIDGSSGMKPGGKHIMIMGLHKDLKAGDKAILTLVFEKAGPKKVEFVVR